MKKIFFKKAAIGIGLGLALLPFMALAVGALPDNVIITSPNDIIALVQKVLGYITTVILVIAVIMLLFSAFLYLTAGGSEDRVGKAKSYLLYAIVGIVVAVLAFSVQPFITAFLSGR